MTKEEQEKLGKEIVERLNKGDNPEYNLAIYELYGFSKEYIKRELNYYDTNL